MRQILAIARLTWKAAFRYRLFWVLAALLICAVVGFPLMLKDDGTAQGFTQILLTYTLSAITALLGFSTLWLACGSLAHDVEDCQMQVVSVKPVARWQIWLGKWLGIMGLNAALLVLSGSAVYTLLMIRSHRLPAQQQTKLQKEIFVARGSFKPQTLDFSADVEKRLADRIQNSQVTPERVKALRKVIAEEVSAERLAVVPGTMHAFEVDLGLRKESLRGVPLRARVKFHSADPYARDDAIYLVLWQIGASDSSKMVRLPPDQFPPDSFQEFEIPPNSFEENGKLRIEFYNQNDTALIFPQEDGFQVLYPESTFGLNFIRGMAIILCWMALLATIGLAAASWLSFPVAAFFSLAVLSFVMCSGVLAGAIEQGTVLGLDHETGRPVQPALDGVILPVFKGMLAVINLVDNFSPIDALSSGRSITWGELGMAVVQIVLLMGGFFAAVGITLFTKRELASAQGTS